MQTMVAWAWCPDQQFTWESRGDSSSDSENVESPQPTVEPPTTGPQADLIATAHELAEIAQDDELLTIGADMLRVFIRERRKALSTLDQ